MNAYDLMQAVQQGVVQNDRLLKLDTPLGKDVLLPLRAVGHSRIGRNYDFTVDTVSVASQIELKQLIAQPVTLWMQQTDGMYLPHHGYVHTASRLGSDGSTVYTQLAFSSWLHFLKFRKDARIWQDKTVEDILSDVFSAHPQARGRFRFSLYKALPNRSFTMQYEDDWNFVHRLMEAEGLWSYFEQASDGQSHTLIITDLAHFCKSVEPSQIAFSRAEVNAEVDALTQWAGTRTLQSVKYVPVTGDYKSPRERRVTYGQTLPNQGNLPEQAEVYEYTGAYSHLDLDRGNSLNRIRMEEWESRAKRFYGTGNIRRVDAGRWFELKDHPDHERDKQRDRCFLIIDTHWTIENNLPVGNARRFPGGLETEIADVRAIHQGQSEGSGGGAGFFLTQIEAQRLEVPFHSPLEHHKPDMRMQSATVVGPQGEEVYTDALNRIKVQFRWDRLTKGDETSSCWMRVMQSDTGSGYGGAHVPRVGEEVYVDWDDGDCDKPIVIGRAYNGEVKPAWHSNGILSGFRSKEYAGSGYNQLVMDDATGQNRVQLYTTSTNAQLHMGYLIAQNDNARGTYLGQGFDLKSDDYGAVRAGKGLYVSTHPAYGEQPLAVDPLHDQLTQSQMLIESLSNASTTAQAESLEAGQKTLEDVTKTTRHTLTAPSGTGGLTAGGGTGEANGFAQPLLAMASPAGIVMSTLKSAHLSADEHLNLVSEENTHLATGRSFIAAAAEKISLFVQKAGMKLFAANGPVEMSAHTDEMRLNAALDLSLTSKKRVVIEATEEIILKCGGSYVRLTKDGIEDGTRGARTIKSASFSRLGPSSVAEHMNSLPQTKFNYPYILRDRISGEVLKNHPYEIIRADGTRLSGVTNELGHVAEQKNDDVESILLRALRVVPKAGTQSA